jgi:hypothetical protein
MAAWRDYPYPYGVVFGAARNAMSQVPKLKVRSVDPSRGIITAGIGVLGNLGENLTVTVGAVTGELTHVSVEVRHRWGLAISPLGAVLSVIAFVSRSGRRGREVSQIFDALGTGLRTAPGGPPPAAVPSPAAVRPPAVWPQRATASPPAAVSPPVVGPPAAGWLPGPTGTPGAQAQAAWTAPAEAGCRVCGRKPAGLFKLRSRFGVLLWFTTAQADGYYCRECALAVFRVEMYRTLTRGWWDFLGLVLFFNWFWVGQNLLSWRKDPPAASAKRTAGSGSLRTAGRPQVDLRPTSRLPLPPPSPLFALTVLVNAAHGR